mmetsp:Transcript_46390/g.122953  ORF Transcript_46390/g.122953 Transcript_46390/m.122953 type:complete len:388 (-) Transcript_46390:437-1600(-)
MVEVLMYEGAHGVPGNTSSMPSCKTLYVLVQELSGSPHFEAGDPVLTVNVSVKENPAQMRTSRSVGKMPLWNQILSIPLTAIPCAAQLVLSEHCKSMIDQGTENLISRGQFEFSVTKNLENNFYDGWLDCAKGDEANDQEPSCSDGEEFLPPRLHIACSLNPSLIDIRQRGLWPTTESSHGIFSLMPSNSDLPDQSAVRSMPSVPASEPPPSRKWQDAYMQKSFRDAFDYRMDEVIGLEADADDGIDEGGSADAFSRRQLHDIGEDPADDATDAFQAGRVCASHSFSGVASALECPPNLEESHSFHADSSSRPRRASDRAAAGLAASLLPPSLLPGGAEEARRRKSCSDALEMDDDTWARLLRSAEPVVAGAEGAAAGPRGRVPGVV